MDTAAEWINKGHEFRCNNNFGKAIECYNMALRIDPGCEALQHREMVMNILQFGNKQIYNV